MDGEVVIMTAAMDPRTVAGRLLDARRRRPLRELGARDLPAEPGMYAWFVDAGGAADLGNGLGTPIDEGLIYAGQAGAGQSSATLVSRFRNHARGNCRGSTFRVTLAAVLSRRLRLAPAGYRRLEPGGEDRLTAWMERHLSLATFAVPDNEALGTLEARVLAHLDPPLNLQGMPGSYARARLTKLRTPLTVSAPAGPRAADEPHRRPMRSPASSAGLTPVELARELGLPNAKSVRAFLRRGFPRPKSELWARWGPLSPEIEAAVRERFGGRR